ncbi:tumor necrosis factor receptor superfamily member 18 isoform X1 [Hippoglossus hippoglossus]|uniref:tumor necrosis factor receptor superfamily member 18 isoform X1 n=1 Tax=Hippoglossus hippoglossus TaxID=8267 RepID=UPI00148CE059|nr:tumor necrosis factor receptor superfamily member 18 isoform X1 [Hippoglossus hippoglossus]
MSHTLVMMVPLKCSVAFIYVLSIWTMGYARSCGGQQALIDELCCDRCGPGEYLKEYCNEHDKTVCSPCAEGFYSDHFNIFDRCEECQSCQHEYAEKCTSTTNAKCSCRSGFLCSNSKCSTCEENKCVAGERVNRTDIPQVGQLIKYSYRCEAACTAHAYFDVKEETCKQRTQCSAFGLAELFPGNKTHNSVCDFFAMLYRPQQYDSWHQLPAALSLLPGDCVYCLCEESMEA